MSHKSADPRITQMYPKRHLESLTMFVSPAAMRTAAVIQGHWQQSQTHSGGDMYALMTVPQSRTLLQHSQRWIVLQVESTTPVTMRVTRVTQLRKEQRSLSYPKHKPACDHTTVMWMPPLHQKTKVHLLR